MPEKNTDHPQVDPQKKMLVSKFGDLKEKVGDGYGGPLQTELINRLEQTIADFHDEVTEMIDTLKDNSERRHEKLKEIWNQDESEIADEPASVEESSPEAPADGSPQEMSAWEKRLETLEGDGDSKDEKSDAAKKPEKKKKKKGLFGRKKK